MHRPDATIETLQNKKKGFFMQVPLATRFQRLLTFLFDRYQFRELKELLKAEKIETAISKEKLVEKITGLTGTSGAEVNKVLTKLCSDIVVAGTKDAFIFDLTSDDVSNIAESFKRLTPTISEYSDAYPLPLSPAELKPVSTDHKLVRKIEHATGDISLVLCAKRSQEDRVTYEYSEVSDEVKKAFSDFNEFIAVRRIDYQIFDVVTLRKSLSRIEILIDQPSRIKSPTTSNSRCTAILGQLSNISPNLNSIYTTNQPLNLACCVSALYHAPTEGRVCRMSFRAPTGSVNKASVTTEDLRKEKFHAGGFEAVGDVTPYDVTITWENLITGQGDVSVQVGMPISSLSKTGGIVDHARIIDARSDDAVVAVINKLVSYSSG